MSTLAALTSTTGALLAGAVICVHVLPTGAQAQLPIRRSPNAFNLFTTEQDIAIGLQSAAEIERQVSVVTSVRTKKYLTEISKVLNQAASASYPFRVSALNSAAVNAYALPGGGIYLTRGILSLTRNEAEVAGLIAHAMAHVILRHGTARASKAWLSRVGVSALGGLQGKDGAARTVINAVGGYGAGAAFLHFSITDEYDADALGAELLSRAGYDPLAMSTILASLRRHRANGAERFFTHHPTADDREGRVRNLSNLLRQGRSEIVGGYSRMRWRGGPSTALATDVKESDGAVEVRQTLALPDVPLPSTEFTRFSSPDAPVEIEHPANWMAHQSGAAMSFVPSGAVIDDEDGAPNLLQGAIVNFYAPFENVVERWNRSLTRHFAPFEDRSRPRGLLEDATDDLVRQILDANAYLRPTTRSAKAEVVDGLRGYRVQLSGRSPLTGQVERVMVYTRMLPDEQVVYLACIAAGRQAIVVERACSRMSQSIRLNDAATNRQ